MEDACQVCKQGQASFLSSQGVKHCKACAPEKHTKVQHIIPDPDDKSKCLLHFASPILSHFEKYPGLLMFEGKSHTRELPKRNARISMNTGIVRGVMAHYIAGKRKQPGEETDKKEEGDQSRTKVDPFETLPDELLIAIFANLDYQSAQSAAATSKRFRALANDKDVWKKLAAMSKDSINMRELEKRAYVNGSIKELLLALGTPHGVGDLLFKTISDEYLGPYERFADMMSTVVGNGMQFAVFHNEDEADYETTREMATTTFFIEKGQTYSYDNAFPLDNDDLEYLKETATGIQRMARNDVPSFGYPLINVAETAIEDDNAKLLQYVLKFFLSMSSLTADQKREFDSFFLGALPSAMLTWGAEQCLAVATSMLDFIPAYASSQATTTQNEIISFAAPQYLRMAQFLVQRNIVNVRDPGAFKIYNASIPLSYVLSSTDSACLIAALENDSYDLFEWLAKSTPTMFSDVRLKQLESPSTLLIYLIIGFVDKILIRYDVVDDAQQRSYIFTGLPLEDFQKALAIVLTSNKEEKGLSDEAIRRTMDGVHLKSRLSAFYWRILYKWRGTDAPEAKEGADMIMEHIVTPIFKRTGFREYDRTAPNVADIVSFLSQ